MHAWADGRGGRKNQSPSIYKRTWRHAQSPKNQVASTCGHSSFFLLLLTHDFDGQIGAPAPWREGAMEKKNYGGREKSIILHFSEAPASSFLSCVRRRSYISFPALVLRVLKKSHRFFDRMRWKEIGQRRRKNPSHHQLHFSHASGRRERSPPQAARRLRFS